MVAEVDRRALMLTAMLLEFPKQIYGFTRGVMEQTTAYRASVYVAIYTWNGDRTTLSVQLGLHCRLCRKYILLGASELTIVRQAIL